MRVTFVSVPPHIGGGQRVIALYAARLHRKGHRVTVVAPPHPPASARQVIRSLLRGRGWPRRDQEHHHTEPGVEIRITGRAGSVTTQDIPDADVVVATWWETAEWVSNFPPEKGARVYLIQGYEAFDYIPVSRLNATWRLPMSKIVVSQWLADLARDRFGDPAATVVPNAVDHDLFFAPPRGRQSVPTVGLMYSSVPFKGIEVAVEAVRAAAKRLPGLRVRAFGTEALPNGLLPAGTEYLRSPPQDSLRQIYAGCDAWLFASRSEGFGLPILEAMACRTPVIGTPAGAAPELLAGGGGILVKPEEPSDMADAIVRVGRMPEGEWRAMSDAASATATRYTWDAAADRFEAALAAAVRARSPA